MSLSVADLNFLGQLCRARAGLRIDAGRAHLVENRLAPLARREGVASVAELMAVLQARRDDKLAWRVVEAMAQGETAFFRDRGPFDLFRDELLPTLARLRGAAPVRVWSAGCATGQEAYSLAMHADDVLGMIPGAKVDIFGSDLSERCLEKAQSGLYTQFEVQRGLPARLLIRHFEQQDEMWAVTPRLRQAVRWRRVNMIADLAPLGRFDIIFCRNLLPSLEEPYAERVLESLAAAVAEDGFLVFGSGEAPPATGAVRPVPGRPGVYARDPAFRAAA